MTPWERGWCSSNKDVIVLGTKHHEKSSLSGSVHHPSGGICPPNVELEYFRWWFESRYCEEVDMNSFKKNIVLKIYL